MNIHSRTRKKRPYPLQRGSRSDLGFEFRSAQRPFNQKGHIYAYARNGEGGICLRRMGLRC
jgi:hypothetical protein